MCVCVCARTLVCESVCREAASPHKPMCCPWGCPHNWVFAVCCTSLSSPALSLFPLLHLSPTVAALTILTTNGDREVLCSSVGRAWRLQHQDSRLDSGEHPHGNIWIQASAKWHIFIVRGRAFYSLKVLPLWYRMCLYIWINQRRAVWLYESTVTVTMWHTGGGV